MLIFIEKTQVRFKKEFTGRVKDLLKDLKINQNNVLITRNNELITEDELLENNDSIKILSVISGG